MRQRLAAVDAAVEAVVGGGGGVGDAVGQTARRRVLIQQVTGGLRVRNTVSVETGDGQ